jgi:pimeloyl-ACP methyl ester carboxylesterase
LSAARVAEPNRSRIETGSVVVDGTAVFFRRVPGEGPPAVLVHGVPSHSGDWLPFLERMEGPAVAFDLPGFGDSDRPAAGSFDYSMNGQADFVQKLLPQLGAGGDYSLVVHDWGSLALIAAQREPERVRRLVVANAVPLLPGYRWHRTARTWRTPVLGELSNRLWTRGALALGLRESRGDWSRHSPEFVDSIWDKLDQGTFRAILPLYRSAPADRLAAAGRRLGLIEAPALVVWGLKDRYLPARFGRAWADALPGAELMELPDAGHWPWLDADGVVERVIGFVERA